LEIDNHFYRFAYNKKQVQEGIETSRRRCNDVYDFFIVFYWFCMDFFYLTCEDDKRNGLDEQSYFLVKNSRLSVWLSELHIERIVVKGLELWGGEKAVG
jgi:hypothetical protein